VSSRIDLLQSRLENLHLQQQQLEQLIAESPAIESELRADEIRKAPTTGGFRGATSPAERERQKRAKKKIELEGILREIESVNHVLTEERQKAREEAMETIRKGVAEHHEHQREAYRRFGQRFAELHAAYLEIADTQERYQAWRESPAVTSVLGGEWEAWASDDGRFLISPAAGDFMRLVFDVYTIACDPKADGWRSSAARPYDDYNELARLTPDLTGHDRPVRLHRHPDIRMSEAGAWSSRHGRGEGWGQSWGG